MIKTKKKFAGKILSIFLSLIIVALSLPIVFAAEPIALTESNVVAWPTIEGTCYFGQTVGDTLTIVGGEVQYDGKTVEGTFSFTDEKLQPAAIAAFRANLTFTPKDSTQYTGFSVRNSKNVTFPVLKTTPVLVDEANDKPITTVKATEGMKLSEIAISGGAIQNPYNPSENRRIMQGWTWENPDMVVEKSDYYNAKTAANNSYNELIYKVYVEYEAPEVPLAQVTSNPTVAGEIIYYSGMTWSEVEFSGGESNVAGTFAVSDEWKNRTVYAGTHNVDVVFTPDDITQAQAVTIQIPVTVNPAPITFETEDGTGVPTITVDYGKKTNDDMGLLLKKYVPEDVQIQYIDFRDLEGNLLEHANKTYDPGSYTFTCRARTQNKNYATTMLTFNVVINKVKISPQIEGNGNRMIIRDVKGQYNPKGTFDLYINDELVKEDIPYNEYFTWEHTTSGDKNFKAVYKPGDDNRYEIDPITRADGEVKLDWPFASGDGYSTTYTYGETVTVEAPATDPAKPDKPYYGFAGWNIVEGNPNLTEEQLASPSISFEMPDGGVKLEPTYEFSLELFFRWIWQQIVDFFTFIFNAITELFALAA